MRDLWKYVPVPGFEGGENVDFVDDALKQNQHLLLQNVDIDSQRAVKRRAGTVKITSSPLVTGKSVLSMFRYYKTDGTKTFLAQAGDKVFTVSPTSGAKTQIASGLDEEPLEWFTYNDKAYAFNGGGSGFYSFDGTTWSNLTGGNIKAVMYARMHQDKMFAAGNSTNPSYMYFSNDYDPETWDAGDIVRLRDNDGDQIRGLTHVVTGHLLVLKDTSSWLVHGSDIDSFSKTMQTDDVGLTGRTLVNVQGRPLWLSRKGVCWYNPYSAVEAFRIVSREKLNSQLVGPFGYTADEQSAAIGHYSPIGNRYLLSFPTATTPTIHVIHLDVVAYTKDNRPFKTFPFTRYVGLAVTAFCSFSGAGDSGYDYWGTDDSHIYRCDPAAYTDDGTNVEIDVQTGYLDAGAPDLRKMVHGVTIPLNVTDDPDPEVSVSILRDWTLSQTVTESAEAVGLTDYLVWSLSNWDEASWADSASGLTTNFRFRFHKMNANKFAVRVQKSSAGEFVMRPFSIRLLPVDHRRWAEQAS